MHTKTIGRKLGGFVRIVSLNILGAIVRLLKQWVEGNL